jgi:hypothetical protein
LFWGFGVTIAGMFAVVGFVIWDRRFRLSTDPYKEKVVEILRQ